MPRLAGKLCLVTGAARGIGAAIARAFAAEGAEVIVTDIDGAAGRETAGPLGAAFHRLDVANEADWAALARGCPASTCW